MRSWRPRRSFLAPGPPRNNWTQAGENRSERAGSGVIAYAGSPVLSSTLRPPSTSSGPEPVEGRPEGSAVEATEAVCSGVERGPQLHQAEDVHEVVVEGSKATGRAVPPGGATGPFGRHARPEWRH